MSAPPRPVLRYHGGKFRLREWIVSHFPTHQVYVEPFGGAASVLLAKPRAPKAEILNDMDGEIVSLYRVLRDPAQARELERLLRLTPFARAEFEAAYDPAPDPIEAARRLIVRSFMGFGTSGVSQKLRTGWRVKAYNSRSSSAQDWATYPEAIVAFCQRLQGVTIENRPALDVIAGHDHPQVLLYCDPPYVQETRSTHPSCRYRFEMDVEGHIALAETLKAFSGMVVLSGYPSALYDELYGDWERYEKRALADGARERTECLWLNPAARKALPGRLEL